MALKMIRYFGPERRKSSREERDKYSTENGIKNGTMTISLSVKSFVAIMVSILSISGAGGLLYEKRGAAAYETRLSVLESKIEDLNKHLNEIGARTEDTNKIIRAIAASKGLMNGNGNIVP